MKFGGIPVEFVPPGMTAEEARRRRKRQFGPNKNDMLMGIGSIVLLLLLCGGSGWYYVGRGRADEAAPAETVVTRLEPAQLTATAGPPSLKNSPPLSPTLTISGTPLPPPLVLSSVAMSPLATPSPLTFPLLGQITATITPTNTAPPVHVAVVDPRPTSTPSPTPAPTVSPYNYEVIGHEVQPSDLYSYVSGWIVEEDGATPRPARARLKFATGEMLFPRPNNRDIANGRYEFMVTPGRYWLSVGDGSPEIQIDVSGDPARYEISFRDLSGSPLSAPARSVPWDEPDHRPARPRPPPAVVVPTIEYRYHIFMPVLLNRPYTDQVFLPLIIN